MRCKRKNRSSLFEELLSEGALCSREDSKENVTDREGSGDDEDELIDRNSIDFDDYSDPVDECLYSRDVEDRVLYWVFKRARRMLPERYLDELDDDADSLRGQGTNLVTKKDIQKMEESLLTPYRVTSLFRCHCGTVLEESHMGHCSNGCVQTIKKSCLSDVLRYHLIEIGPQIEKLFSRLGDVIISTHEAIHFSREVEPNDDVVNSDWYKEKIENRNEWNAQEISISLVLHTDGFRAKSGNCRDELWPLNLALLDLPANLRFLPENLMMAGILVAPRHPKTEDMNVLLSRLRSELVKLSAVEIKGYRLKLKVVTVLADLPALKLLFNLNDYSSGICNRCDEEVFRAAGAYKFSGTSTTIKDRGYHENCAKAIGIDYRGTSEMTEICNFYDSYVDWMHTYAEGVLTDILRDIVGASGSRRNALKVSKDTVEAIARCIEEIKMPTYYQGRLFDIRKYSAASATDREQHGYVSIPLLCASSAISNPRIAAYAWIIVSFARHLLRDDLCSSDIEEIAIGIEEAGLLWMNVFGVESLTKKVHDFLVHIPELLRERQNVSSVDTSPFEHLNLFYREFFNPKATNSFDKLCMKRILLYRTSHLLLRERAPLSNAECLRNQLLHFNERKFQLSRGFMKFKEDLLVQPHTGPVEQVPGEVDDLLDSTFGRATANHTVITDVYCMTALPDPSSFILPPSKNFRQVNLGYCVDKAVESKENTSRGQIRIFIREFLKQAVIPSAAPLKITASETRIPKDWNYIDIYTRTMLDQAVLTSMKLKAGASKLVNPSLIVDACSWRKEVSAKLAESISDLRRHRFSPYTDQEHRFINGFNEPDAERSHASHAEQMKVSPQVAPQHTAMVSQRVPLAVDEPSDSKPSPLSFASCTNRVSTPPLYGDIHNSASFQALPRNEVYNVYTPLEEDFNNYHRLTSLNHSNVGYEDLEDEQKLTFL